jgi:orotate phosphoribosyltransferase
MDDTKTKIADALYNSCCLKFGSFHIKSGALSPYYIDFASLLSSPTDLCAVADAVSDRVRNIASSTRIDKLASIELKGALLLASIGCRTGLPCTVVRKEVKTYGATGRIAGANIVKGDHVLFFDDVVSEGLSKLEGINALEQLGAKVEHIFVVVDREQGGLLTLEKAGYRVHALARISEIVESLLESKHVSMAQAEAVLGYVRDH